MSEPTLCVPCAADEPTECERPGHVSCRDELELYRDGVHGERARTLRILVTRAERIRSAGGWFVPDDAYEAVLSGREALAAVEPREEGSEGA